MQYALFFWYEVKSANYFVAYSKPNRSLNYVVLLFTLAQNNKLGVWIFLPKIMGMA
jgi:hypothetical protein